MKTIIIDGIEYIPKNKEEITTQHISEKNIRWGKSSEEEMDWEEAKEWCEEQGGRLPTRLELLHAYEDKIEGFKADYYWSATEYGTTSAWRQSFDTGIQLSYHKSYFNYVRCVFGD